MTNWERYFGSPEAAMRMGVRMMTWPLLIVVDEVEALAPRRRVRVLRGVRGVAACRIRRRNDKVGRMSRPGCNRGCLLIIAASLLIDGLTLWAAVSLARMIIGG